MEGHCSTGQSPQWAVVPMEEEEEEEDALIFQIYFWNKTLYIFGGQFLCSSSGILHCTHSNGICHTGLLTACEQDPAQSLC